MSDFAKVWDPDLLAGDLKIDGAGFAESPTLETVVINALFSDARATPEDLARMGLAADADPRGWWGDTYATVSGDRFGSRLWTLWRAKQTQETLNLARDFAEQALGFLVEDGIARTVEVEAEWFSRGHLALGIYPVLVDGHRAELHFSHPLGTA